jgi:signal transduction histidine kinase
VIAFLLDRFARGVRRALDVARAAVTAREEFVSIASHELQTPLTVLKLQLQQLAQTTRSQAPAASEAKLRAADAQVTRLARLVGNMLDLSRLQSGKLVLEPTDTRLEQIVRGVVAELRPMAERSGSTLEVTVETAVQGHWDALRLEQVISNLLSNAIKYGEGKPIHLKLSRQGPEAELSLRDEGVGIAPADLERLFVQFERGRQTRTQSGVGLGLYIAKQLVEAMGGSLSVSSVMNQGATFTLRLPASPEAGDAERASP